MSSVSYTIDAPSPVLQYSGTGWAPISASSDPAFALYNNETARATYVAGDEVVFQFVGTGIWLYGAKRGNHGDYTVNLDGTSTTANGFNDAGQIPALLFSATNLARGTHTIRLTNSPTSTDAGTWLDLDYLQFEDSPPCVDPSTSKSQNPSIQTLFAVNTDHALTFTPEDAWQSDTSANATLSPSLKRTRSSSGSVSLTFRGTSAAIYGRVGPNAGSLICGVDWKANVTHSAYASVVADQQVLCIANDLEDEETHTLRMWNQPGSSNTWLEVDFAQVWGTDPSLSPLAHHTPKLALIAGVASFMSVLCLAIIGLSIFYFIRKRRAAHARERKIAYAQVRLDEGEGEVEDWTMASISPYTLGNSSHGHGGEGAEPVTAGTEAFPGDALGVYSGLASAIGTVSAIATGSARTSSGVNADAGPSTGQHDRSRSSSQSYSTPYDVQRPPPSPLPYPKSRNSSHSFITTPSPSLSRSPSQTQSRSRSSSIMATGVPTRQTTMDTTAGTIGSGSSTRTSMHRQGFARPLSTHSIPNAGPFGDSYAASSQNPSGRPSSSHESQYAPQPQSQDVSRASGSGGSGAPLWVRVRREEDAGLLMTDRDFADDDAGSVISLPPDYASVPGSSRGETSRQAVGAGVGDVDAPRGRGRDEKRPR